MSALKHIGGCKICGKEVMPHRALCHYHFRQQNNESVRKCVRKPKVVIPEAYYITKTRKFNKNLFHNDIVSNYIIYDVCKSKNDLSTSTLPFQIEMEAWKWDIGSY